MAKLAFKQKIMSALLLYPLISIAPAHAWSEETHMTTGAIAFDTLASIEPASLDIIADIITAHPHYDKLRANTANLTGKARLRMMLQWMARWPDDIRGTQYSRPEWHTELRVVYGRTWLWPFRNQSALEGLDINYRLLADPKSSKEQKAIALCWLLHVIGDIQQPLHAGHQMTAEFPATDEAGLLAYIRKASDGKRLNLHQYWDKILDESGPVTATSDKWAPLLQSEWAYGPKTMTNYQGNMQQQFGYWLDESAALARKIAYSGSYLKATPDPKDAPKITLREQKIAVELSKRRVVTGGYRIADTITAALK